MWHVNNNFVGDPVEDQTTSRSSSSTVFACDSYGVVYEVYLRTVCGMDYEGHLPSICTEGTMRHHLSQRQSS